MQKRLMLLLNPRAGRYRYLSTKKEARRQLWGYRLDFVAPHDHAELAAVVREIDASASSYRALLICGGDGTVNTMLPHLIGRSIPIVPVPLGTANDLASCLGIRYDWPDIQMLLDRGEDGAIDVIRANDKHFVTVGGMGVGALLTHDINELRKRSLSFKALHTLVRSEIYTLMTARTIMLGKGFTHRVRIRLAHDPSIHPTETSSCEQTEIETGVVLVCNQSFLGGDLHVTPGSQNDDGTMEVLVGGCQNRRELMHLLLDIKRGRSSMLSRLYRGRHLEVEDLDGRPIMIFGDGETLSSSPHVRFEVKPRALRVLRHRRRSQTTEKIAAEAR